jgi:hypothetical protein
MGASLEQALLCRDILDSIGCVSIGSFRDSARHMVTIGYRRYLMRMYGTFFVRNMIAGTQTLIEGRKLDSNWILNYGTPAGDGHFTDY